jgi:molybdopterin molybdotransferase
MPAFSNSSMDGFAVRASDLAGVSPQRPAHLHVIADIPAGTVPFTMIGPGEAARIMTGAALPPGADAVIPVEDTQYKSFDQDTGAAGHIEIAKPVFAGDYLRPAGQDFRSGDLLLRAGSDLRPADVGLLATLGIGFVPVNKRSRVAVLSSGDELVPVGQPVGPGEIYDANSLMLSALIHQNGGEALLLGIARDNEHSVRSILDRGVDLDVDMIVSSAGVSIGAYDYVRQVIQEQGNLQLWRVNLRPGKPFAYGDYKGIPFFGLPGNPVSAYVTFEVFVLPAMNILHGRRQSGNRVASVILRQAIESDGRESYLRGWIARSNGQLVASLAGHQGSANLKALVDANAFLVIPSGVKSLPAGSRVDAWLIGSIEDIPDESVD